MKKFLSFLSVVALTVTTAFAATPEQRVTQLFVAAGFDQTLTDITKLSESLFAAFPSEAAPDADPKSPEAIMGTMGRIFREEFSTEKLKSLAVAYFVKIIDDKNVPKVLAGLNKPAFKKILEAEAARNEYLDLNGPFDFYLGLEEDMQKSIRDYKSDKKISEFYAFFFDFSINFSISALKLTQPDAGLSSIDYLTEMKGSITDLVNSPQVQSSMAGSLAENYKDIAQKDLKSYLAFYLTPEGKWLLDKEFEAMKVAYNLASEKATARLEAEMKKNN